MKRFFRSGAFFMVVALLCFAAGVIAENGHIFLGIGVVWLVIAIVTRARYAESNKQSS